MAWVDCELWAEHDARPLPLVLLERICQVLDLHPTELFRAPARKVHQRE